MAEQESGKGRIISWIAIIIAVGFLAMAFYNYRRSQAKKKTVVKEAASVPVTVAKVEEFLMERLLETNGDLRPLVDVYVFPKIAGRVIEKILVDKGDRVKKGQLLVVLDDSLVKARLARANAALDAARSSWDCWRRIKSGWNFSFPIKPLPASSLTG